MFEQRLELGLDSRTRLEREAERNSVNVRWSASA
jgi:hypothetical protein